MDVATRVVDRPGRVKILREHIGVTVKPPVCQCILNIPSLIERRPGDYRGVISVPLDNLAPLTQEIPCRQTGIIAVQSPGWTFRPDDVSKPVGLIEELFLEHLLV